MSAETKVRSIVERMAPWTNGPFPVKDLPAEDGIPLETYWHRLAMTLLIESLAYFWRDRKDLFVGGNMFIYFSEAQVRNEDFRGPDFFFVWGVNRYRQRDYWAVWDEDYHYPNVIIQLTSPTTEHIDRTEKKQVYEQIFKTPDYFIVDRLTHSIEGWHLQNGVYEPIEANEQGWLWSDELKLWLGNWQGKFLEIPDIYPRFYEPDGELVLIGREAEEQNAKQEKQRVKQEKQRADQEKQRADQEKQRADAAEAELAQLRARIAELEGKNGTS